MSTPATGGPAAFSPAEVVRGVPRTVWIVTVAFVCVCASYAFLAPTYRPPDEIAHVDVVYGLRTGDGIAVPMERRFSPRVYATYEWLGMDVTQPDPQAADEAAPRDQRPSLREVAPVPRSRHFWKFNWVSNHPPLYYLLQAGLLAVTPGVLDWGFDQVVMWLRLSNVVMVAPLPLLVFATARRLTPSRPVAVAAAALPLAVPQLTHVVGAVNNDNLLNVSAAAVVLVATAVAGGDLSRRTALWAGAALGVALLAKAFAVTLLVLLAAAYLLGWARRRGWLPWQPVLVAFGTAFVVGGWWWVRNILVHGRAQPAGAPPLSPSDEPLRQGADFWVDMFTRWLVERIWGSFGWLDTPIPWEVAFIAVVIVLLGIALALALPGRRADVVVLLLPATLALVLMAVAVWGHYVETRIPAGIQGRYLYVGLAGVAVAVALGYGKLLRGAARWLPLLVAAGAVVLHVVGVTTILARYWGDGDSPVLEALQGVIAWSPWDGMWLAAGWGLTLLVAAATVASMAHDALTPSVRRERDTATLPSPADTTTRVQP